MVAPWIKRRRVRLIQAQKEAQQAAAAAAEVVEPAPTVTEEAKAEPVKAPQKTEPKKKPSVQKTEPKKKPSTRSRKPRKGAKGN